MIVVELSGPGVVKIPIRAANGVELKEVILLPGRNRVDDKDWEAVERYLQAHRLKATVVQEPGRKVAVKEEKPKAPDKPVETKRRKLRE